LGTLIVELSAVISLVTYYTERYWLCFICSALWGISETFFQSNTGALISLEYKGKLEGKLYYYSAYSVFRIFFAIGVTSTLLINVILSKTDAPGEIFILLVLVFQMINNMAAQSLETRPRYDDLEKQSLIEDKG
jgi:MFS family permease